MTPDNANKTLINSDYPLDKVVFMASGSFTEPSGGFGEYNVPHGLPFRPLLVGTWSTDPNFTISYEAGTSGFTDLSIAQLTIQSTTNTIRLLPTNYTGSTITYYWRVFGFMPSDVNLDASFTAAQADLFAMSSEYNYTKLWQEGVLLWNGTTQTINHGFGYRPQVDIWFEQELNSNLLTRWYQGIDNSFMGTDSVQVTDTQIIFRFLSSGGVAGRKWFYRIYQDTGVGI